MMTGDMMMTDGFALIPYSPAQGVIEGTVETAAQKAERERQEIKKKRATLAYTVKNEHRRLAGDTADYRLAKFALVAAGSVGTGIILGWILTVVWAFTIQFSGRDGGSVAFCIIALVVLTIADGFGLAATIPLTYHKRRAVRSARYRHTDAIEASADYEMELVEAIKD